MTTIFLKNQTTTNTVYVFIDASNLWEAQKAKGRFLDYEKTIEFIQQEFKASLSFRKISNGNLFYR